MVDRHRVVRPAGTAQPVPKRARRSRAGKPRAKPAAGAVRRWLNVLTGRTFWFAVLLVALSVAAYEPVRHAAFLDFDDYEYVVDNPHVTGGLSWAAAAWAFTTGHATNWHPVTWLSHMADVQLFGLDPGAHHLVNLGLHVINALLLFWLLRRMTGASGRSAFVAALFALHPLHVESVAWISERKDLLSTAFGLLTIGVYVRFVSRPGWRRYAIVVLAYAFGLMAKPMLVTLPFVLLLLDVWPLERLGPRTEGRSLRPWWPLVLEKLPLVALAAVSSIVTFLVQRAGGAVNGNGMEPVPLLLRLENAVTAYVAYMGQMIWPVRLAAMYPYPHAISAWSVAASLAVLVAVSAAAVLMVARRPYVFTGWFWFVGMLVPVIGLIRVGDQSMADRYTYMPLIGLFVIVAWGTWDLCGRWSWRGPVLSVAAGASILSCALLTRNQVAVWQDTATLWRHALQATSDNYVAASGLGQALVEQGRYQEAVPLLEEAIRLNPNPARAHDLLGVALAYQGKMDEAIAELSTAVRIQPDLADAHNNLGLVLASRGRMAEATAHYREALRAQPDFAGAHNNLGQALANENRPEDAVAQFTEALRLDPKFAAAHNNLGLALVRMGQADAAVGHYATALQLRPDFAEAQFNLGLVLAAQGRTDDAIAHYLEAVRLRPELAAAHYNLGLAFIKQGDIVDARRAFTLVLQLDPQNADARHALDSLPAAK